MMLTPHFDLSEFVTSDTAVRLRIDNTPTKEILENIQRVAELMESVRAVLGHPVIIKSGYRSPALNKAVGGVPTSEHQDGRACDFICPAYGTPLQVCQALRKSNLQWNQLIHEFGAWVHISVPRIGTAPRMEELTYRHDSPVIRGIV